MTPLNLSADARQTLLQAMQDRRDLIVGGSSSDVAAHGPEWAQAELARCDSLIGQLAIAPVATDVPFRPVVAAASPEVIEQYKDLRFVMSECWPIVHGSTDANLKNTWTVLLRETGDFAEQESTLSVELNRRLYSALNSARGLIADSHYRQSLLDNVERQLGRHADLGVAPKSPAVAEPLPTDVLELMMYALDRLNEYGDVNAVIEETGITARVSEALAARKSPKFVVVQEGGSSTEIYLHVHDTAAEAEDDRVACADASYRTSAVVEVPGEVAALGAPFYGAVEDILKASLDFDYVDVPEGYGDALASKKVQFAALQKDHAQVLHKLAGAISERGAEDAISDFLDDYADKLKGEFSATAANSEEDKDQQNDVISDAEEWVADNVSHADLETRVAAVLWFEGVEKLEQVVNDELSKLEQARVRNEAPRG